MARGEYAAAIAAYQQSDLKSAIVWNNIGMAYHHLFALAEARKAYQQALTLNPRFAPAANNLAAVYYGQHEFRVAEHWYKKGAETYLGERGYLLQSGHGLFCRGQDEERHQDVSESLLH